MHYVKFDNESRRCVLYSHIRFSWLTSIYGLFFIIPNYKLKDHYWFLVLLQNLGFIVRQLKLRTCFVLSACSNIVGSLQIFFSTVVLPVSNRSVNYGVRIHHNLCSFTFAQKIFNYKTNAIQLLMMLRSYLFLTNAYIPSIIKLLTYKKTKK